MCVPGSRETLQPPNATATSARKSDLRQNGMCVCASTYIHIYIYIYIQVARMPRIIHRKKGRGGMEEEVGRKKDEEGGFFDFH